MLDTLYTLERLAAARGTTVYRLCADAGVSYNTVRSARKRGTQLSLDTLEYLCRALDVSVSAFIAEAERTAAENRSGKESGNV